MKNLTKYVAQKNAWAKIFKDRQYDVNNLTAEDAQKLYEGLENELSPENLSCDGEVRGAQLQAKARLLNGAVKELRSLGFALKEYSY